MVIGPMSKTLPGAHASFTSIAFETGRILGREEAAKMLESIAASWRKTSGLNYRAELVRLAAEIRRTTMNPEITKEAPDYVVEHPQATNKDKESR